MTGGVRRAGIIGEFRGIWRLSETVSGTGHIVQPYGAGLFPESGFCRNRGNGSNQGTFPRSFPLPAVFFDRRRDNGTSSEPDWEETQAWDGDDRPEVKTEKDRDTGKQKTGPSHSVGTISCRMDETILSSIEPDGSSGFRH